MPGLTEVVTEINSDHGWSVETVLAHVVTMVTSLDRRYEQRFEAEREVMEAATATIVRLLDERDRRYEERFRAQQEAVVVALAVVNKEFHEHLIQVREETASALTATEKAIAKADTATEKRFESVNEFRSQLADQAVTFMPRLEIENMHRNLSEKVEDNSRRTADGLVVIGSRLDTMAGLAAGTNVEARLEAISRQIDGNTNSIIHEAGAKSGGREVVQERRQNASAIYAAIGIGITILSFLMAFGGYLAARP